MSTRSTRRPPTTAPLSSIEALLLAQATWERGAAPSSWNSIAKIMAEHPLLSRPKSFFTAKSCHAMYEGLLKDAGLESNESSLEPQAVTNRKLAEKHFHARFQELRELIVAEETKFKTVLKEIEEIQSGLWDKKIEAKVTGQPLADVIQQTETPTAGSSAAAVLGGSDPSKVKDSADSQPMQENDGETIADIELPSDHGVDAHVNQSSTSVVSILESPDRDGADNGPVPLLGVVEKSAEANEAIGNDGAGRIISQVASISPDEAEDIEMTEVEAVPEHEVALEQPAGSISKSAGRRLEEEEEEEEARQEEENKEEEEETSQGQAGDQTDEDQTEDEGPPSPKSRGPENNETDSEPMHTPAADTATSEVDVDGQTSEPEEPIVPTRRSTRRKSSAASAPAPITRTRARGRARVSEAENPVVESDNDDESKEETPGLDDERVSSPFEAGLSKRRDGKRKASYVDSVDSTQDKKRLREDSEPADDEEPGPSSHNTRARTSRQSNKTEEQVAMKKWQTVIGMLHQQISQHRNGTIFHNPIKNSEAPDYHEIVKRPMDLKTIKTRIKDGIIGNSLEFQRDIYLMFANAMMYNRPGSDVYAMAEDMMQESEDQINAFRQTEGLVMIKRRS